MDSGTVPRTLGALLLAVALAPAQFDVPAGYDHFYVDKLRGCPTNNGSIGSPWRDLSDGYAKMATAAAGPAVLHVADGYYTAGNGEVFPIEMREKHLIQGRNAFTTIVEGDVEVGSLADAFSFGIQSNDFFVTDGPYLSRLSIRKFMKGVAIQRIHEADVLSPVLHTLVIYDCDDAGIWGEQATPIILDCTVTQNANGIVKYVAVSADTSDCTQWTVINTICRDNTTTDMENIGLNEAAHCNVDPAKCVYTTNNAQAAICPPPFICANGTLACRFNVNLPNGFVNAAPATGVLQYSTSQFTPAREEYDFRLASTSPLRSLGIATGVTFDGEGLGNPRVLPFPASGTAEAPDIGADEYDVLQVFPLIRGVEPSTSQGSPPCAAPLSDPRCGADGYRLKFRIDGEAGFKAFLALHDYLYTGSPVPPPIATPYVLPLPALGTAWIEPNLLWFFPAKVQQAPAPAPAVDVVTDGVSPAVVEMPLNDDTPNDQFNSGPPLGTPTYANFVIPFSYASNIWSRAALQIVFVHETTNQVRLSNYQEYGLIF
jgi:hypothetical protein